MALFGNRDKEQPQNKPAQPQGYRQLPPRSVYCRICDAQRTFSRVWQRLTPVTVCTCCKTPFDDPAALYRQTLPACPRCGEFLEQPGFDYGLCDNCHSKYEIVPGTKPSLLPNKQQRDAMNQFGKTWSP